MDVLLVHPPAAKAAEPPLGTAVLLAHLRASGLSAEAIDANIDACLYLLQGDRLKVVTGANPSTVLRRAMKNLAESMALLRSPAAPASFARYSTAVRHLNAALAGYRGHGGNERLTLGDYRHEALSPFAPVDLDRLAAGRATTLFRDYFEDRLLPQIAELQPKWVALSVNYLHQVLPAFELAGLIRRRLPRMRLVGGGGVFSSWKTSLKRHDLRFGAFSRIVFGAGEGPLAALAAADAIDGEYFMEGSGSPGFRPDFSFAPLGDYLSPVPVLPVSASRGCYWRRCLFCPEAAAPTQPFAVHPAEAFPELLLDLARQYRVAHFHLTDNALPVSSLVAMAARCDDLHRLSWHGFVRFEQALLDRGLVEKLARGGCRMLQLGLESGSQRVLDRLGKGTRLEEAGAVLKNLRQAGIETYVYLMLGTPGETEEDAEQTLRFVERYSESIGYLNLSLMNLPRDSTLVQDPAGFGIGAPILPDEEMSLSLYRSFVPAGDWDRGAARRFLQQRLQGSPAVRAIINRTPPLFTSNHAFLFPRP